MNQHEKQKRDEMANSLRQELGILPKADKPGYFDLVELYVMVSAVKAIKEAAGKVNSK